MSTLQRRIEQLERVRRGSAVSAPDPLTPAERIAAVTAMRDQVANEGYTAACLAAVLAYIDRGIDRLQGRIGVE